MSSSSGLPEAGLWAGAATADITPAYSMFLFGYPHVPRMSTGVHDRLTASALYLRNGDEAVIFIATDLIFLGRAEVREARRRIAAQTGVAEAVIEITSTHTHSGPVMVDHVNNGSDSVVPKVDRGYLAFVVDRLAEAGAAAVRSAMPAEAGLVVADARGIGTNRHDPAGPADPSVPVLLVRSRHQPRLLACMVAYAMHTTVLHEDSTLISSDFPHFTRQYLRDRHLVPADCPILYHNGASGNQSPRHVTKANTFAEARRLGEMLGAAIEKVWPQVAFSSTLAVKVRSVLLPLDPRQLPSIAAAQAGEKQARHRLESLRQARAPRTEVRTAECDWFGAEEAVALAESSADGRLAHAIADCSPAEIHVVSLGSWRFVLWPGEFFVEYALAVKAADPRAFVITLANGELQGYIVTPEAVERGYYEGNNAVFAASNGQRVVDATLALLRTEN
ncbi:MAG: neutral/alkaline non-lysosomal ceramidase N-terminal domain-containing protein [Verrucomicrobia bacterium]|nr:neutral/alkaline non-lysosomal ceramidase N-terminal domain-containing protein [Verrucomicrobiota bacterium]